MIDFLKKCFLLCMLLVTFSSCSRAQSVPSNKVEAVKDKKVLVVYLSRTKNTQTVAKIIHEQVGGKLVALELKMPYPEDYKAIVAQVASENETGFRPPLKTIVDSIAKYDVIFIGFPTWGMKLPPPIKSFLTQYDLGGKTIVPFNTNAGYGLGSSFGELKNLSPESTVLKAYTTKGGIERDGIHFVMEGERKVEVKAEVKKWLQELKLIK
ncbi:flavodoxin [compost metagenome]